MKKLKTVGAVMLVMTMMLSNTTAAMAETKSLNDWLISTYTGSGKTQVVVTSSGETNPCTIIVQYWMVTRR